MPRIAKLVQSGGTPSAPAVIVNLNPNEEAMATGLMAGCCSAILLWNLNNNGQYQNVRGHHADADPANIDWTNLVNGVPNNPQQAKLIIACAKDNLNPQHHYNYRNKVLQALPQVIFGNGNPCALTPTFYGFSDVLVFRTGIVIALTGADYQKFDVR